MKIWHISDTHCQHNQLALPDEIDVVVHSGDASSSIDIVKNIAQLRNFFEWFSGLQIKHKIFSPGNHDVSLHRNFITKQEIEGAGINLLLESGLTIDGINFWGSPWVPRYGDWAWMVDRSKLHQKWSHIPDDTNVLVTHGPPFSCLDATYNHKNDIELVGCRALQKRVKALNLDAHLFGHIHSDGDIQNNGTRTMLGLKTVFSNGSCCDDRKMDGVTSNGNIITLS
jgi:Icc-related predicted phosphoesterase